MEEEDQKGNEITEKMIKESIKKNGGYDTPRLNEKLYLHYLSITDITNLDQFTGLRSLWLNNNAISEIKGLSQLTNLNSLFLHNNLLEKIEGLENLHHLKNLILSYNYITQIEGLEGLHELNTLEIDHNKLKRPDSISGISAAPSITVLNISENGIEDPAFAEYLPTLPNLRVLRNSGNPVCRNMSDHRRQLIAKNKELRYLDDTPVEDEDRRVIHAWARGGLSAEQNEKVLIHDEKAAAVHEAVMEFNRLQKEGILERGEKLEDHPELLDDDGNFTSNFMDIDD
ncbi:Leucine Rich Repeat family protein [Trichomonas vaginalis G3]|uniref:Leucine Rich Repeat family protein n=1 Tax=Trichomonas vaginalis (strain ATCC PRA-98 / G3) TaxID=412133 RepID=A2DAI7_TRIV3|nr:uncharacterized protein TVAGG3_0811160 [Trichomonas vaginalis G3]EAY22490.1 Leucine Rich Repeat family protein [Trichomonas vaginalis G3]KAI5497215.1 axoneme assembly [Trichomonas vaginalis G3]|eukprot:XP_001583476.1 hypothetical protein [Trichomonas vaginalis G3]